MVAPTFVSDEELAAHPVIVVGRWNRTPLVPHHQPSDPERPGSWEYEVRTGITVERVIKGEVNPGNHIILLAEYAIVWREDTGWLANYISTMMEGDVRDVREANLWFLIMKRSWDVADQQPFLTLKTYRGVQPLKLEGYFQALRSANAREEIPRFLHDPDAEIVLRALEYVAGRYKPGMYIDGEYFGGGALWVERSTFDFDTEWDDFGVERHIETATRIHPPRTFPWARSSSEPLVEQEAMVRSLLANPDLDIRRRAADVYGDLAGERGIPIFRGLLQDADEYIRAIAIGWLCTYRDSDSAATICEVVNSITNTELASPLRALLASWRTEQSP